jgi:lipid-A-disaccharide synthase-like uncharacterized protein
MSPELKWYIGCAVLALAWKCFQYCYVGTLRLGKPLKQCQREWFELMTIDAKVSWIATLLGVYGLGTVFVAGVGMDWVNSLTGGILSAVPVQNWTAGLLGIAAEYIVPNLFKKLVEKYPVLGKAFGGAQ